MKWVMVIVAILMLLLGTVWALQGLDILKQGFMAGHIEYTIVGVLVDVIAIGLIVMASRRRKTGGAGPRAAGK